MDTLKVGQSMDVFRVDNNGEYGRDVLPIGQFVLGTDYKGYGADLVVPNSCMCGTLYYSYKTKTISAACTRVGKLTITKLK